MISLPGSLTDQETKLGAAEIDSSPAGEEKGLVVDGV
jgi:hypothetical protein